MAVGHFERGRSRKLCVISFHNAPLALLPDLSSAQPMPKVAQSTHKKPNHSKRLLRNVHAHRHRHSYHLQVRGYLFLPFTSLKMAFGKFLVFAHTPPPPPKQAWGPVGMRGFRVGDAKCVAIMKSLLASLDPGVLRGVLVITLGSHPRDPGFDSRAE